MDSNEPSDFEDEEFSRADLLNFLGEFLSDNRDANTLYRGHLCGVFVARIYEEFGAEGLCDLMMQIDLRASWMSDIIFEKADFNNALFKKYGVYDDEIVEKARQSESMIELNKKIWRLRKKYATIIIDEVMQDSYNEE